MSEKKRPLTVAPDSDTGALVTWIRDVVRQVRLAWRLFWDRRVPLWTKIIPPAVLAYILSPVDFIPDPGLGLGQLDDVALVLLGIKLFIELAPPDVVREHLIALGARLQEWRVVDEESKGVVIEGEYSLKAPEVEQAEEHTQ
ncbi:MAG: DUF1232 domain-containing protein [Anaerolineae bacterium]|nr:DUF1232 domain-containing protein [Anaerolineae bacterium]